MDDADAVHVTLVRHGESESNRTKRWQGQGDSPLSALGRAQAERVGARLAGRRFDRVFSSDLSRAADTAAATGFEVERDPAFRELNVGRWEGLTRQEVFEQFPDEMTQLSSGKDLPLGGGETYADFVARVDKALRRVCGAMAPGERILVVCHGGVIGAAVSTTLGVRGRGRWPISRVSNTSITEIAWMPERSQLRVFNDDLHLEGSEALQEDEEDTSWHGVALDDPTRDEAALRSWLAAFAHHYDLSGALAQPDWLQARPYPTAAQEGRLVDWLRYVGDTHGAELAACLAPAADLQAWVTQALSLPSGPTASLSAPRAGTFARIRGGDRPVLRAYNTDSRY